MIWQYDGMLKEKERERELERQWIKRKHTNMFRGSSTQLYVPAFTQKDFQSTYPHRTPTQGTSTEDLGQIQPGVHNSSLNRIQPLTEATQTPPHTRGVGT